MSNQTLPEEQNALLINAKGARMTLGRRHVPKPAAGQVIVHNIAAALNPVDWSDNPVLVNGCLTYTP